MDSCTGIKIAILDSGLWEAHPEIVRTNYQLFTLSADPVSGCIEAIEGGCDEIGHGTAVYNIIRKQLPEISITVFRIFEQEAELDSDLFAKYLEFVGNWEKFDIINLSLGVTFCENVSDLYSICDSITRRGTIIVSAFDNGGAVSFPAAFDNVIGVDSSLEYKTIHDYAYIENSIINIIGKGTIQRVAWRTPSYIISQGSSFTCAYISAIVAEILMDGFHGMADVLKQLKIRAKDIRGFSDSGRKGRPMPIIKKAVLFPFNKEMHAIALFQDMLNFTIIDIYDSAKSGRVGATVSKIMHTGESEIIKDFIIKDIRNVDMSQFDTMILGHTSDLQQLLGDSSIIDDLLRRLSINNKQVFAFDNLTDWNPSVWSCRIDSNSLPQNRFGKLFQITKPVLGVVGTSSKQGKFTLQLLLRRRFLKDGYRVGQMGTEPSSLLFGMDEVFPCGYNTSIYISNEDILLYLNTKMWEISQKNYDIIITGSQASVLSYATYNTRTYPLVHQQYLQAVAPDALIICVNPFDELHFVRSNIYAAEALSKGRVIAAVCFPLKMKDDWSGTLGTREFLSDSEINTLKKLYSEKMQLPLYVLGVESEMDDLYQDCVAFFINS